MPAGQGPRDDTPHQPAGSSSSPFPSMARGESRGLPPPLRLPKEPRKVERRQPLRGNKRETLEDIARRVPISAIREYFNFSLRQAADAMSISVTSLKRLCRQYGVRRWPHRQLSSVNRSVLQLEEHMSGSPNGASVSEELHLLYAKRDDIIENAFTGEPDTEERRGSEDSDASDGVPRQRQEEAEEEEAAAEDDGGSTPSSFTVWWQRKPGSNPWQHQQPQQHERQRSSSDNTRGTGAVAEAGGEATSAKWRGLSRPPGDGDSDDRGSGNGNGSSHTTDGQERDFRASRVLARMSSMPTHASTATTVASATASQARGSLQAPLPRAGAPDADPLAVLNALLLGGGPSEDMGAPGSSAGRAGLKRPAPATPPASGAAAGARRRINGDEGGGGGGGGAAAGGGWEGMQNDSCGVPLQSIMRLVAAGALLSDPSEGDQTHSHRDRGLADVL